MVVSARCSLKPIWSDLTKQMGLIPMSVQEGHILSAEIILYGTRSPLVVDYEETAQRLGIRVAAGIALGGPIRMLNRRVAIEKAQIAQHQLSAPFIPCAFGPRRRQELASDAIAAGLRASDALVDPTAVVAQSVRMGVMTFVNAAAVIGGACLIGDRVVVNRCASIGHHCFIGDDVSIGPGATLASNIQLGNGVIIGVGATILPDVKIGAGAIVAGGSVVRSSVEADTLVAGNPASARQYDISKSIFGVGEEE